MSQGFPKKINPYHLLILAEIKTLCGQPPVLSTESWSRKSEQSDKWSFCLTAGTLCPTNQERP
jgi:hypothetical protein